MVCFSFLQLLFDPEIFFFGILPPIIFYAGFSLQKVHVRACTGVCTILWTRSWTFFCVHQIAAAFLLVQTDCSELVSCLSSYSHLVHTWADSDCIHQLIPIASLVPRLLILVASLPVWLNKCDQWQSKWAFLLLMPPFSHFPFPLSLLPASLPPSLPLSLFPSILCSFFPPSIPPFLPTHKCTNVNIDPQRHFFRNLGSLLLYAFAGTTVSCFIVG